MYSVKLQVENYSAWYIERIQKLLYKFDRLHLYVFPFLRFHIGKKTV